jgi:hypothetical protein
VAVATQAVDDVHEEQREEVIADGLMEKLLPIS